MHRTRSILLSLSLALVGGFVAAESEDEALASKLDTETRVAEVARQHLAAELGGEFTLRGVHLDQIGQAHVRFDQLQAGIPVFTGQAILHVNVADGSLRVDERPGRVLRT